MDIKCTATNKDGRPCSARPWKDGVCRWHHPDLEEQRAEARRRGGYGKSNAVRAAKAMPTTLTSDELLLTLSRAIRKVEEGTLPPGPANAMAGLARAMNAIRETTELEARIVDLEAHVSGKRRVS